jgi:hypothetical protein
VVRLLKIHSDRIPRSTIKHEEGLKRFRCRLLRLPRFPCAFRPEENQKSLARNGACSWKSTLKPREVLAKPPERCPARRVTASTMPGNGPKELVRCAMRRAAHCCATNTATIAYRPAPRGRTTSGLSIIRTSFSLSPEFRFCCKSCGARWRRRLWPVNARSCRACYLER